MSEKRRRLSTDIQLLEQRSAELSASTSRRLDAINGELRNWLSPLGTVALGAGAGFLAERLTGGFTPGRSVSRLGGVLISLLSSLGSAGAAVAASDAAETAEAGAAASRSAASAEQPADAPL